MGIRTLKSNDSTIELIIIKPWVLEIALTHPYNSAIYHINKIGLWYFGQSRHTHHLPAYGHDKACALVNDQIVHINIEVAVQAALRRIIGKGILRFGHTNR